MQFGKNFSQIENRRSTRSHFRQSRFELKNFPYSSSGAEPGNAIFCVRIQIFLPQTLCTRAMIPHWNVEFVEHVHRERARKIRNKVNKIPLFGWKYSLYMVFSCRRTHRESSLSRIEFESYRQGERKVDRNRNQNRQSGVTLQTNWCDENCVSTELCACPMPLIVSEMNAICEINWIEIKWTAENWIEIRSTSWAIKI